MVYLRFCFVLLVLLWNGLASMLRADDLASLCDEFDNAATLADFSRVYQSEGWNANQLQTFDINTSQAGWMRMVPYASTWYQDYRGELTYKNVSGDFVVTTYVRATNRAGTAAPSSSFSLAGIMVRTPRNITPATWTPGGENYVFLSLGAANNPNTYQFEVKTTTNSVSTLVTQAANVNEAEIQVARLGSSLIMLRRAAGGSWTVHRRYTRSDFPNTLQAGLTVYTDYPTCSAYTPFNHNSTVITGGNPDLDARFDFLRYRRPVVPPNLQGANFADPGQVNDEQLLSFLGDNANDPQTTQSGTLAFDNATYQVNEGAGTVTLNIVRSGGSDGAVSVVCNTSNGTAQAESDFTTTSTTVNFVAGETSKTFTVPITDDAVTEGNESFTVALTNAAGGATLGTPVTATVTIADNDQTASPLLSINDVSVTEGHNGSTNATFTVTLSALSAQSVSVNAVPTNGSARSPGDYTGGGVRLTFDPGETTQTFSVPVQGDNLDEINELFYVLLSSPTNATISRGRGIGTIVDDDAQPSITIDNVSIGEGNSGQRVAAFRLVLSQASGQVVRVMAATGGGSATAGDDYTALASTQISFSTGALYAYARVFINGDLLHETNETFFVNLTNPVNATMVDNQAVGTILNDDRIPSLTVADASASEGNNGTKNLTFTVTLSAPSGQNVTVNYATANGSAQPISDYNSVSGTLTFAPGVTTRTLNVVLNGDTQIETDETFYLLLSSANNATIGRGRALGTIINDDSSG